MGLNLFYLGDLGSNFKKLLLYLMSALICLSKYKVSCKTKKLEIWDQKNIILVFLGRFLKKTIAMFEISTLEFVKVKTFM